MSAGNFRLATQTASFSWACPALLEGKEPHFWVTTHIFRLDSTKVTTVPNCSATPMHGMTLVYWLVVLTSERLTERYSLQRGGGKRPLIGMSECCGDSSGGIQPPGSRSMNVVISRLLCPPSAADAT